MTIFESNFDLGGTEATPELFGNKPMDLSFLVPEDVYSVSRSNIGDATGGKQYYFFSWGVSNGDGSERKLFDMGILKLNYILVTGDNEILVEFTDAETDQRTTAISWFSSEKRSGDGLRSTEIILPKWMYNDHVFAKLAKELSIKYDSV